VTVDDWVNLWLWLMRIAAVVVIAFGSWVLWRSFE